MSTLVNISKEGKFTSLELVSQINAFREQEGNNSVLLHKSLNKKIEVEFEDEINEQNILPVSYKGGNGQQRKMYELNGDEALQLLNSESKFVRKATVKLIRSMEEKINNLQPAIPQTYAEALRLAAETVEANEALKLEVSAKSSKIEEDAPKVEIYNDLISSDDLIPFNVGCKALDIGLRKLYAFLRKRNIVSSKRGSNYNIPHQPYIDSGYFVVKAKPYKNTYTDKEGISLTAHITGSGMIWLENYLNKNY